jgi:hypothetical protein
MGKMVNRSPSRYREVKCAFCGTLFLTNHSQGKYCSLECKRKKIYQNNKEKIKKQSRQYYWEKKELIKAYKKQYYLENKEKIIIQKKQYRLENKHKIKQYCLKNKDHRNKSSKRWQKVNKTYYKNYWKNKYNSDLKFNLNAKMSSAIRESLKNNKNKWHWETLVGYTVIDLKNHLEKTIPQGYTWQDYLDGKLHIDHIIPVSAFNFDSTEHVDFNRCWALENLRLLPAKDNLVKNAKLSKPFQPALKI